VELGEGRAYWAKVLCAFCPTEKLVAVATKKAK